MKKMLLALALLTTVPATVVFAKEDKDVTEVVIKNASGETIAMRRL